MHQCIAAMSSHLHAYSSPSDSLFSSTTLMDFAPKQADILVDLLDGLNTNTILLQQLCRDLNVQDGRIPYCDTLEDHRWIINAINLSSARPDIRDINTLSAHWQSSAKTIISLVATGCELQTKKTQFFDYFDYGVINVNWDKELAVFQSGITGWRSFFSFEFHLARKKVKRFLKGLPLPSLPTLVTWLTEVSEYQKGMMELLLSSPALRDVLGDHFNDAATDWQTLLPRLQWLFDVAQLTQHKKLGQACHSFCHSSIPLTISVSTLDKASKCLVNYDEIRKKLSRLLRISGKQLTQQFDKIPLHESGSFQFDLNQMYALCQFNRLANALDELDLSAWSSLAFSWKGDPTYLTVGFNYRYADGLLAIAYQSREPVRHFDQKAHNDLINKLMTLEPDLFMYYQQQIIKQWEVQCTSAYHEKGAEIIRCELMKKRGRKQIRQLLSETMTVMQTIKPVFMMSPASISAFLPRSAALFDVVIFDEASQLAISESIPAILRAKQVIVVGDTKQMPPARLFEKKRSASISCDFSEKENRHPILDVESLLHAFIAAGAPQKWLRWHYRSQHPSLIDFSNRAFYQDSLFLFPTTERGSRKKVGLTYTYLPDAIYDMAATRTNPEEAKAVAQAVIEHALSSPSQTLGVVALSRAQRDCILMALENLKKKHSESLPFFALKSEVGGFFVKNVENVQGDERDCIFISVGYGNNKAGRFSLQLGALSAEGGERRLNVMITRAKKAMRVFCNLDPHTVNLPEHASEGLRSLIGFLTHAYDQRSKSVCLPDKSNGSDYVSLIRNELEKRGYQVDAFDKNEQMLFSLAIVDPSNPRRYILAIQTDENVCLPRVSLGDGERIRKLQLSSLGWQCHRIWAVDWYRDSAREIQRIECIIKENKCDYFLKEQAHII